MQIYNLDSKMSYSEKNQKKSEIPKSLYENISQKIWIDQVLKYNQFLKNRQFLSPYTIRNYLTDLIDFFKFLNNSSIKSINDLNKNHIREYMRWLSMSNVSRKSISRKLSSLKTFFSYLEEHNEIFHNPKHPYTKALLSVVPKLGSMKGRPLPAKFSNIDVKRAEGESQNYGRGLARKRDSQL